MQLEKSLRELRLMKNQPDERFYMACVVVCLKLVISPAIIFAAWFVCKQF